MESAGLHVSQKRAYDGWVTGAENMTADFGTTLKVENAF